MELKTAIFLVLFLISSILFLVLAPSAHATKQYRLRNHSTLLCLK